MSWASYDYGNIVLDQDILLIKKINSKDTDTECYVFKDTKHGATVIAFRGTKGAKDVLTDIKCIKHKVYNTDSSYNVHKGFWDAWSSVAKEVTEYLYDNKPENVVFTGHSLGGALATLAASALFYTDPIVVTFGAPKVGDRKFKNYYNKVTQNSIRMVLDDDMVPYLASWGYRHVKELIHLDEKGNEIKYNFFRKLFSALFRRKVKFDLDDHNCSSYEKAVLQWMNK